MPQKFIFLVPNDNFLAVGRRRSESLVSRGCRYRCHANVGRYDGKEGLNRRSVAVTRHFVLFLASSTVLEPDLRHSLTQSGHVSDSLEILAVGVAVNVEVRLKDLKLFFGECCTDAFGFVFVETVAVIAVCWK